MSIGSFAATGRVSVRTLRHYDDIGLLRPAAIDPRTGYRSYTTAQLTRLNRILALRDLGFSLDETATMLADGTDGADLRRMLIARRDQIVADVTRARERLARVEGRIRTLQEAPVDTSTIELKSLPVQHLAVITARAASFDPDDITPVIVPLYPTLMERLAAAGVDIVGPSTAWYTDAPDGDGVIVHAGFPIAPEITSVAGLDVFDLPQVARALTTVYRGPMDSCGPTYAALIEYAEAHGLELDGYSRERYLECPEDLAEWVTELQFVVRS